MILIKNWVFIEDLYDLLVGVGSTQVLGKYLRVQLDGTSRADLADSVIVSVG